MHIKVHNEQKRERLKHTAWWLSSILNLFRGKGQSAITPDRLLGVSPLEPATAEEFTRMMDRNQQLREQRFDLEELEAQRESIL